MRHRDGPGVGVSMRRLSLVLLTLAAVGPAMTGEANAAMVYESLPADPLYIQISWLAPMETVTYEALNLSPGADSVLHLWDIAAGKEVAFADSFISFQNPTSTTRQYAFVMRAEDASSHGTADLEVNGALVSGLVLGGLRVDVDDGPGYEFDAVCAVGCNNNLHSFGLDAGGHMVELDYWSGYLGTHLSHPDIDEIVVAPSSPTVPVNVYANDPDDEDGDGLGTLLEAALGTCDDDVAPGCDVFDPRDTDRDGISDSAEVLGIEAGYGSQLLPRMGADPRHKDVFVEIDYESSFGSNPFTEADALLVQEKFDAGSAADLQNPDGLPGVRVHLDIDKACPSQPTVCGDWVGSNGVPPGIGLGDAANDHMNPAREDVFRYALMRDGGNEGQAIGPEFHWSASWGNRQLLTFTHELGHTLGIGHEGNPSWGLVNAKPHYASLMNYSYPGFEFSLGENDMVLDPSLVDESAGIGTDASHLAGWPYYREVGPADEVDWDFDFTFAEGHGEQVRAPLTYATYGGSGALGTNQAEIVDDPGLPGVTPALAQGPYDRMYAFHVGADDRLYYQLADMDGPGADGSCPGGAELGDVCTQWSAPVQVPTDHDVLGISVVFEEYAMMIAYRADDDEVRLRRMFVRSSSGALTPYGPDLPLGDHTDTAPEIHVMRVDPANFGGDDHVVAIFYRHPLGGAYRWKTMANAWTSLVTSQGLVLDEAGSPIEGREAPTFVNWPYDPHGSPQGTSCGALTDTAGHVRIYCYDAGSNRFEQLPAFEGQGPVTAGKPGLAYHAYRSYLGEPHLGDPSRGAFWLAVTEDHVEYDRVRVWISDPVSEQPGEALADLVFPDERQGWFYNRWMNLIEGSGLVLYDDPTLGAMKALAVHDNHSDLYAWSRIARFYPFADGTFRAELRDGNDFHIMERGICAGLLGKPACGPSTWGLE